METKHDRHIITREIGIDMGHRVTFHGSKCRNLHGHRYTVEATCIGPLFEDGEQQGMVLDFGFLKEIMMSEIDEPCDHGLTLWVKDPLTYAFLHNHFGQYNGEWDEMELAVSETGYKEIRIAHPEPGAINNNPTNQGGKYYITNFVPTAENLAKHWFDRLAPLVKARTNNQANLHQVKVWETPNCTASFPTYG